MPFVLAISNFIRYNKIIFFTAITRYGINITAPQGMWLMDKERVVE